MQVYASRPIFTDNATLIEARRRLFSSRCRLAHLLGCRARLASLFHHLSPKASPSSLEKRLTDAGFVFDSTAAFSRRIDVLVPPISPPILLEWPPVPSDIANLEGLPSQELDFVNPLLANDMSRFSWMVNADSLFGASGSSGGASSLLADDDDLQELDDEVKLDGTAVKKEEVVESKKTSSVLPNGIANKGDGGLKKEPVKSTVSCDWFTLLLNQKIYRLFVIYQFGSVST